ncbi:signal peptidase I SipW [Cytobacillus eiseniae]|uniref:signal peptidase I SipW n=1 Tax=Cytobacillus eiseniae TaxID=762947 RepID=UPI00082DA6A2|nr:signal peptidase I [Cytobacillus eiseniae]
MKKVTKVISNLITAFLFMVVVFMAILVISTKASGGEPQVLGYQLKSVLSGSMEPTFLTGSIIAVEKVEGEAKKGLKDGDVITFVDSEERLVTHRIIGIKTSGEHVMYETKGDNNNAADMDPVLSDNVQAVYTGFTIPYVGYLINFAQSKEGSALLLIVPGLLLLGYAGFSIYQGLRELDPKKNEKDTEEKTA